MSDRESDFAAYGIEQLVDMHMRESDLTELEAELLEALEDVLGWHDDADNLYKPIEVRAAYMRARAAIAKAKGGDA